MKTRMYAKLIGVQSIRIARNAISEYDHSVNKVISDLNKALGDGYCVELVGAPSFEDSMCFQAIALYRWEPIPEEM